MNTCANDNIRDALLLQAETLNITWLDILFYAKADDAIVDTICDKMGELSNDDISDAIARIIADKHHLKSTKLQLKRMYEQHSLKYVLDFVFDTIKPTADDLAKLETLLQK